MNCNIKDILRFSKNNKVTHIIEIYNRIDKEYSLREVYNTENICVVIENILKKLDTSKEVISKVYNLSINLSEQLKEDIPLHILPNNDYEKVALTLEFAVKKHINQTRKDGTPFIIHPMRVKDFIAHLRIENNCELLVSALLHDTLEDTDTSYEELVSNFGSNVANLVLEVTNDEEEKKRKGKEKYLREKMVAMSDNALILKLADRLDNVSDLAVTSEAFRTKYMHETIGILNYVLQNRNLNYIHLYIMAEIANRIDFINLYCNYHDKRTNELVNLIDEEKEKKLTL